MPGRRVLELRQGTLRAGSTRARATPRNAACRVDACSSYAKGKRRVRVDARLSDGKGAGVSESTYPGLRRGSRHVRVGATWPGAAEGEGPGLPEAKRPRAGVSCGHRGAIVDCLGGAGVARHTVGAG